METIESFADEPRDPSNRPFERAGCHRRVLA